MFDHIDYFKAKLIFIKYLINAPRLLTKFGADICNEQRTPATTKIQNCKRREVETSKVSLIASSK